MTNKERQDARFARDRARRAEKRRKWSEACCDYKNMIDIDTLKEKFFKCKEGVGWKCSIQNFGLHLYPELKKLHNTLIVDGDVSKGYYYFWIMERGKKRHIESCHISERTVQKSFSDNCFTPIFEPYLIPNNCSSRSGKGTSAAVNYFKRDLIRAQRMHKGDFYIVQGDVHNYFGSIPHDKLIEVLDEIIFDERIRTFYHRNINRHGDAGIGLGCQNNQNFATVYLNSLDHYVTNQLHSKFYGRFNDDFYIMVKTKAEAKRMVELVRAKFAELGLELSERKTKIVRSTHMVTYLKQRFVLLPEGRVIIKPNRRSAVRIRRKLKAFVAKIKKRKMTYKQVENYFKSTMGVFKDRQAYKTRVELCKYFNQLYINEWCHNQA
jgi:hypothetical protein